MNELVSSIDRTKLVTVEQLTDDIVAYRSQVLPRYSFNTHTLTHSLMFECVSIEHMNKPNGQTYRRIHIPDKRIQIQTVRHTKQTHTR